MARHFNWLAFGMVWPCSHLLSVDGFTPTFSQSVAWLMFANSLALTILFPMSFLVSSVPKYASKTIVDPVYR